MPACRDRDACRWGKELRRKQQDLIAQKRLVDGAKDIVRNALLQVDALNFGAEFRCQRADGERQAQIGGGIHGVGRNSISDKCSRRPWGS